MCYLMFLSVLLFIGKMESFTTVPGMDYFETVSKHVKYLTAAVAAVEKSKTCCIENADKNIIKHVQWLGVEHVEQTCSNVSAFIYFVFLYFLLFRLQRLISNNRANKTKTCCCMNKTMSLFCFIKHDTFRTVSLCLCFWHLAPGTVNLSEADKFSVTYTASHFPSVLKN